MYIRGESMSKELEDILKENISAKGDKIVNAELTVKKLSFLQLRDAIWKIGRVVAELEDDNTYIAAIKSGKMKANTAYLAIKLLPGKLEIVGYAKEGLFHQNTVENAVKSLEEAIGERDSEDEKKKTDKDVKSKGKAKKIVFGVIISVIAIVAVLYFFLINPAIAATHDYNEAVDAFNEMSVGYDEALSLVCVDNIEGISASAGKLEKESEAIQDVIKTVCHGNTADKINNDTATIYKLIDSMETDLLIVAQIANPSSDWVESKLKNISSVNEIEAVTEDNDPNKMLGKEGGYTSCIYFTISDIDSDSVEGDTVVEKGTDAGGAIEVFPSVEDAEARCEYLAGFDNTLLYSGSYAIVGTMVIRTSYRLDGESQLNLTNEITQEFTKL